ncbi:MAG: N-acetylmuramoyl-L-alanine amidase [Thermodesulfobacteriota bacterium]|nr:N-acetylmuramoyl-L-alanine amidase [Thermodesulfobacteriota bacterium]
MMNVEKKPSFFILLFCITAVLFSCASSAATVKTRFFEAENCYKSLSDNPKKQKYRSYWQKCIGRFMAVYESDPDGPWAAAGLYRAGVMYDEMFGVSYRSADRQTAIDLFRRVQTEFPESAYSGKAARKLADMGVSQPAVKTPVVKRKSPGKAKARYFQAEACYKDLRHSPGKQKYRSYWKNCINTYRGVYEYDPDGPWAAAGLYMTGKLYSELYKHSYSKGDVEESAAIFRQIVRDYPESAYAERAATALIEITGDASVQLASEKQPIKPDGIAEICETGMTYADQNGTSSSESGPSVVTNLRYWSNPSYTRVVIDADNKTTFTHNLLRKDPKNGKPPRLYVDVNNSRLDRELSRQIPINDDLLKNVRAGQFTPSAVRVVIDIKSFERYNIFSLNNPFRIVIDVMGENGSATTADAGRSAQQTGPASLAEQLSLKVRRIVIDPGHGGKDSGAPGCQYGVKEKEIVLEIAQKLATKIHRELACETIITRTGDEFLTLEERTAIANMKNADLFVSIHTNACPSDGAYGIETYFLNFATDEDAMRVAALENSTSRKNISDLQEILQDLMQNAKINESSRLAGYVQNSLCGELKKHYNRIKNKGVKQAPFYVLLGAQMPAILVETGFISNRMECDRLVNTTYQDRLCNGIVKGLKAYIDRTRSATFQWTQEG